MERFARDATRLRYGVVAAAGLALGAAPAWAAIITDPSFFGPIAGQTTTITFETNGAGAAMSLIQGQSQAMPAGEYSSQGVMFNSVRWVNDGNASFDAAQALLGLGEVAIPSSQFSVFDIEFTGVVRAVAMWVINNTQVSEGAPTITAFNAQGQAIESAVFGGVFVDGSVGVAQYGYMGLFTNEPIARVRVTKDAAIIDNVTFSAIPGPGAAALLGLAGAWASRRRR